MTLNHIAKAAAAAILASVAGLAVAAGPDQTIAVTATVSPVCKFTIGALTMTFTIDPSSASDATADTTVTYKCTNGVTPVLTPTVGGLLTSGANTMAYAVAVSGGATAGTGFSNPVTSTIRGTILQTTFVDKPAGAYTDTVTVSINN